MKKQAQSGVFLIEALIAILIFSLGILGMVAMGGSAIAAQTDAQFRTEAANYATEMASSIALGVDRNTPGQLVPSLQAFAHRPATGGGPMCSFTGAVSTNPLVSTWVDRVRGAVAGVNGLPGATDSTEQIQVDVSQAGTGFNKVTITVCWKPPSTSATTALYAWHQHVLVTYVGQ